MDFAADVPDSCVAGGEGVLWDGEECLDVSWGTGHLARGDEVTVLLSQHGAFRVCVNGTSVAFAPKVHVPLQGPLYPLLELMGATQGIELRCPEPAPPSPPSLPVARARGAHEVAQSVGSRTPAAPRATCGPAESVGSRTPAAPRASRGPALPGGRAGRVAKRGGAAALEPPTSDLRGPPGRPCPATVRRQASGAGHRQASSPTFVMPMAALAPQEDGAGFERPRAPPMAHEPPPERPSRGAAELCASQAPEDSSGRWPWPRPPSTEAWGAHLVLPPVATESFATMHMKDDAASVADLSTACSSPRCGSTPVLVVAGHAPSLERRRAGRPPKGNLVSCHHYAWPEDLEVDPDEQG